MKNMQIALSLLLSTVLSASTVALAKHHKTTSESTGAKTQLKAEAKEVSISHAKKNRRKALAARTEESNKSETNKGETNKAEAGKTTEKGQGLGGLFGRFGFREPSTETPGTAARREARSNTSNQEHAGQVFVHGYTKKNGTKVEGYWRKKPGA